MIPIGAAVHKGLFDIDTPIAHYGVKPQANWSVTGTDYFPQVTARHLLAQASGVGRVPPGTHYTYDSDDYIQHISYLLNATAGVNTTAKRWATDHFAVPLGTPTITECKPCNGFLPGFPPRSTVRLRYSRSVRVPADGPANDWEHAHKA